MVGMSQKKGAKGGIPKVAEPQQNPTGWKNPDRKSWAEAKKKGGLAWPGA
jgi:hypothetical protein